MSTFSDLIKQAHAMTAQKQDYRLWDNAVIQAQIRAVKTDVPNALEVVFPINKRRDSIN